MKSPATLSVCMIVKNEETVLDACLQDTTRFADELIIVDTGSTDRTKEIAACYTTQVYDFTWCDDFAAARNFSYGKAGCDYIMWLDADDRIDDENCRKIHAWKAEASGSLILAGYARPENGGVFIYPRIVKRSKGFIWQGIIHEHLVPPEEMRLSKADVVQADFVIRHAKHGEPDYARNIRIMEKLSEQELHDSFWLCAQCYLDCVLSGKIDKAAYYLALAEKSATPFAERLSDYQLINNVLKYRKLYDALLQWNAMYLRSKEQNVWAL
ncbi:MAG: glycosyltransferase family 2 protein [Treponema sp.]|nr:glycosyltransferase family 2 protein [Treponema sp.]